MKFTQSFSASLLLTVSLFTNAQNIDDQVNQLVANMTLDEKVGQMTQV
ncbi:MAG: hypothetical protein GWO82_06735, partial [Bacteroidetes bacterium]|nr:hypothetical protein [Bacteroidota bacterium]